MVSALTPFSATVAKTGFGFFVFCASFFGLWHLQEAITLRTPLPGGAGANEPCAMWFVGSSTIHRWTTMTRDMAPWHVRNRGVEGAMVEEVASRLETENSAEIPKIVAFYVGENDIAHGASAEQASAGAIKMIIATERKIPGVRTVVIGLKPSPMRWGFRNEQLRYNAIVANFVKTRPNTRFIDFGDKLLVGGKPGPYYDSSGIHLNAEGYRLWGGEVRQAFDRLPDPAACAAKPPVAA